MKPCLPLGDTGNIPIWCMDKITHIFILGWYSEGEKTASLKLHNFLIKKRATAQRPAPLNAGEACSTFSTAKREGYSCVD